MAGDHFTKKNLVLQLNTGHVEQIVNALLHFDLLGERRCILIFDNVSALEPPGKIHRHEPAGQKTGQSEYPANGPENLFANRPWPGTEFLEPFADPAAVVPFLTLDLSYLSFLRRVFQRSPVAAISVSSRDLP